VTFFAAATAAPVVKMTSTLSRTNSAAISAKRSVRPSAQRTSIVTFRPSVQPSSRSRCTKAAVHGPQVEGEAVPRKLDGLQLRWLLSARHERPCRRAAKQHDELPTFNAAPHVWMAPAWQEIIWRAAQRSLAVMCPACWCSPGGLLALMGSANRVLIIRTGSMSQ